MKGYFAGLTKNGKPNIWGNGSTSFKVKSDNCFQLCDNCEVVNE